MPPFILYDMNRIESFITAHIGDGINECDDNFAVNFENKCFAVADGSSSDFFSNLYARILADTFVSEGEGMFAEEKIKDINLKWRDQVQQKLKEAGCKPGSFPFVRFQKRDPGCSTLIGLHLYKSNEGPKFRCSGLGDSVLFFIPKGEKKPSIQFSSYSNEKYTLDQTVVFGYVPIISRSYSTKWIEDIKEVEMPLQEGVFYLMTDGLAEWILRRDNGDISEKFEALSIIHSQEDFLLYIDDIRSSGAHNDDMTLMKVYIDDLALSFDHTQDNVYDYRSEIAKIEKEELMKRQESLKKEEELARKTASTIDNKNSETAALYAAAKARTVAGKEKKEELKPQNQTRTAVAVATTEKKKDEECAEENNLHKEGKKTAEEKERKDAEDAPEDDAQNQASIDGTIATTEKEKDEEYAEQNKLQEKDKKNTEEKGRKDAEDAPEDDAQNQASIDGTIATTEKEKDEEFAEQNKPHEEEKNTAEKKKLPDWLLHLNKKNIISSSLIIFFIGCLVFAISLKNNESTEMAKVKIELDNMKDIHATDSIIIDSITANNKKIEAQLAELRKENDNLTNQLNNTRSENKLLRTEIDKLKKEKQ